MNHQQGQQQHWESVYGPKYGSENRRGCWIIFTSEVDRDWEMIKLWTSEGLLGYMSSVSPNPMNEGSNAGDYTICVHTSADNDGTEQLRVKATLEERGFSNEIQRYQVNYDIAESSDESCSGSEDEYEY